jgi:hypothetical protein
MTIFTFGSYVVSSNNVESSDTLESNINSSGNISENEYYYDGYSNILIEGETVTATLQSTLPPIPEPTPTPDCSTRIVERVSVGGYTLVKLAICDENMVCMEYGDGLDCTRDDDVVLKYCPCNG